MAAQTPPTTVVYLGGGSCAGVDAILSGTPIMGSGTSALSYWDSTGAELKCDITSASRGTAHIGISDVFATTCFSCRWSPRVGLRRPRSRAGDDVRGPPDSLEKAISAEAAYNIYGFGAAVGGPALDLRGPHLPARRAVGHAGDDRHRDRRAGRPMEGNGHDVEQRLADARRHGEFSQSIDRDPVGRGGAGQPHQRSRCSRTRTSARPARCFPTAARARTTRRTCAAASTRSGGRCTCS